MAERMAMSFQEYILNTDFKYIGKNVQCVHGAIVLPMVWLSIVLFYSTVTH